MELPHRSPRLAHCLQGSRVATAALAVLLSLCAGPRVAAGDAHADYMLHCQGCHGPAGGGAPGGVPSFQGTVAKFLSVPGGREFLIRVPGTAQSELSDARVAALLNWMVREFDAADVPPDFAPFGEAEVARLRRSPLTDVSAVRRRLMDQIDTGVPAAMPAGGE